MRALLSAMIREEWRLHATLFDYRLFVLFPVLLAVMAAGSTLFLPVLRGNMPGSHLALLGHYTFLLFGLSVGAFGLLGRDMLTRRFGQAQVLAAVARILPLTDRRILAAFFVKDLLFYMLLWIGPALLGFGLTAPLMGVAGRQVELLALTLPLSFLAGLAVAFALSTLYAHSPRALLVVLAALGAAVGLDMLSLNAEAIRLLPPYQLFRCPGLTPLVATLGITLVCLAVSLAFPRVDYAGPTPRHPNTFRLLARWLPAGVHAPHVAKDLLDLKRSQGGMGKIVFALLLPTAVIWLLFHVLEEFIPGLDFLVVFALFVGLIASSIYNWLTELDSVASYAFLPVSVGGVIRGKVYSYALLNLVPVAVILAAALASGRMASLVPALLVYAGVSSYTVAVTVYLTGLFPTVLLYNVQVFGLYTLLISPLLLLFLFLSALNIWYLAGALLLLPLAHYVLHHAYHRWNHWEPPA